MPTLKDIAAACGVSVASVSKALNHAPDISGETSERIRRAAHAMGYHPNAAARFLKTRRTYNIGVLFEDATHSGLTHEYFSHVLDALKTGVESRGYDVTFISRDLGASGMSFLEHCRYRGCDGVAIANVDFEDPDVEALVNSEIPVVTIDREFESCCAVLSDNVQGMRALTEYVYSLGHRRIAFVHGEDAPVTRARLSGFRQTCEAYGLDIPAEYLRPARFHDPERTGLAVRELLALPERPTCILCPDDIALLGGVDEIERQGLRVPDDVCVAGYDGIGLSQLVRPRLTTLYQDSARLGRETARLLVEEIEAGSSGQPRRVTVPGRLIPGETVRAI